MQTVGYGDFGVSARYTDRSEVVVFGENSLDPLTQHFLKPNPRNNGANAKASYAMVTTASGNAYVFGQGIIIDLDKSKVFPFPKGDLVVSVGNALHMPGIATTTRVKQVEVEMIEPLSRTTLGGAIPREWTVADMRLDTETPFNQVRVALAHAQATQAVQADATPVTSRQGVGF